MATALAARLARLAEKAAVRGPEQFTYAFFDSYADFERALANGELPKHTRSYIGIRLEDI